MAIKNQALVLNFYAWDTANSQGKTGDSANFTMRIIKDGGAATAPTNAVSEPDSTNCPGLYEITLTATEMNANAITLHGKSSTANITIYPRHVETVDPADFKADVSGLSTFDPSTDEVDIGKVKGVAVSSVDDFKADVSNITASISQSDIDSIVSRVLALIQDYLNTDIISRDGEYRILQKTYGIDNKITVDYSYEEAPHRQLLTTRTK